MATQYIWKLALGALLVFPAFPMAQAESPPESGQAQAPSAEQATTSNHAETGRSPDGAANSSSGASAAAAAQPSESTAQQTPIKSQESAAKEPAPSTQAAKQPTAMENLPLEIERIEGDTIYYKTLAGSSALKPLKTSLEDLKYLGTIRAPEGGLPYLLVLAKPCKDCQNDRGVFMIRADGARQTQFVQPGRIIEPDTGAVVLDSRAFYGRCLPKIQEGYVAFQKEFIERRRRGRRIKTFESSVLVAQPSKDYIEDKLIERRLPSINTTLKLVKSKQCFEIEGRHRKVSKMDIKIRRDNGPDADDDDEVKEGETPPEEITTAGKS
jgi:hypothetical protein